MKEERVFEEESVFFEKIFPFLNENYESGKWSPACYLIKKDILVIEDLRVLGYKLRDKFFDEIDLLKSALGTIARLHGCSILAESRVRLLFNMI